MQEIIHLVETHEANTGETMTELSRRATGKADTIRNWKRGLKEGKEFSAKFDYVQAVLEAMGVRLRLAGAGLAVQSPEERLSSALIAYGIDKDELPQVFKAIKGFVNDVGGVQSQSDRPHDQSELASPRRASAPSR